MAFLKCEECKYEEQCPVFWSYLNAACITIQKEKENKMTDNSKFEVDRDWYVSFIGQLNKSMMDVEQSYFEDISILKVRSKKTRKLLCTRMITNNNNEFYYIFEMPDDDERVEPKPVMKITLDDRNDVQAFFDILNKIQKEAKK